jgi:hypothetical protein
VARSSINLSDKEGRFTTTQALAWADLGADTLRYWKKNLKPIAGRDGRSCGYTLEEIVALAVANKAATQLNVSFKVFAEHAEALFEGVAEHLRSSSKPHLLIIHDGQLSFVSGPHLPNVEAFALVRVDLVLSDIKARMTAPQAEPASQFSLFG